MRELREGSVAEMVARIAREHGEAASAAPQTETVSPELPEVAEAPRTSPRRPGRLFPDAPELRA